MATSGDSSEPAPLIDDATLFIDTTRESFQRFLSDPPAWAAEHLTVIAWVVDRSARSLLLVEHRMHGWSCPGGHVEVAESPQRAVARELNEETGLTGTVEGSALTVARSVGCARSAMAVHWTVGFLVAADSAASAASLVAEPGQPVRWFSFADLPTPRPSDIDLVLELDLL